METGSLEDYNALIKLISRPKLLLVSSLLRGYKVLKDGTVQITLPVGTTIQDAGKLLNAAAKEKGMKYPVFYEGDTKFWAKNEANTDLQTEPGRTYHFKIPTDSVLKTRSEQVRDHGDGAPLGAIAIAEACERLNAENNGTLFKDADGGRVWVRASAPGVALLSPADLGVRVLGRYDDRCSYHVAFAPSVLARN